MSRPRWALAMPYGAPLRQAAAGRLRPPRLRALGSRWQGVLGGSAGLRSREK